MVFLLFFLPQACPFWFFSYAIFYGYILSFFLKFWMDEWDIYIRTFKTYEVLFTELKQMSFPNATYLYSFLYV